MDYFPRYARGLFQVPGSSIRCPVCGQRVLDGTLSPDSVVELKCRRCKNKVKIGQTIVPPAELSEYRCEACNALLFKAFLTIGTRLLVRCRKSDCKHKVRLYVLS